MKVNLSGKFTIGNQTLTIIYSSSKRSYFDSKTFSEIISDFISVFARLEKKNPSGIVLFWMKSTLFVFCSPYKLFGDDDRLSS